MVVGDAHVFPGCLTSALTLFFPKPQLLFSHASAEVRGENTSGRKFALNGDQTHNHQVMSPTRPPMSHSMIRDVLLGVMYHVDLLNPLLPEYDSC